MGRRVVSPVLPLEGFVRLPTVLQVLGIGKTSLWTGIREGRYPRPVKLGPRTAAWRVEDIRALIASFKNDGQISVSLRQKEKNHG